MTGCVVYARTSTDDLQDPADSLRWQAETAERLIAPYGEVVTVYHDVDKSRSLPWERRPEASRILHQLRDQGRGWEALVVAEPQRPSQARSSRASCSSSPTGACPSGCPSSVVPLTSTTTGTTWRCPITGR